MQAVERPSAAWLHRSPYHEALVQLAQLEETDARAFVAHVLEVDAHLLRVARVSYWSFTNELESIVCEDLYAADEIKHTGGQSLTAARYPRYFAALRDARAIAADNAQTDPRTSEFRDSYLVPHKITAMLDVPVRRHGELVGILCHEHCEGERHWTREELDFAGAIADAVALGLETAERNKLTFSLREREKQLSLLAHRLPAVIWTTDLRLTVTMAEGAALDPIGLRPEVLEGTSVADWFEVDRNRDELLSMHQRAISGQSCAGVMQRNGRHLELRVEPFRDEHENIVGAIGFAMDVTRRTHAEQLRDRMLREEQRAHEQAERARERADFLSRAGQALTKNLDETACIDAICAQCVPFLADWCALVLVDEEGQVSPLVGPMPASVRLDGAWRDARIDQQAPDGMPQALRTRRAVVHPVVTDEMMRADGEHWPVIGTRDPRIVGDVLHIGVRSYLALPLVVDERVIGAIAMFRRTDEHPYDASTVEVANQFAARAAGALERSRLHRRVVEAVKVRDEFLSFAAHELFTPLTALELALDGLRRTLSSGKKLNDRQLDVAIAQGKRMARLVSELLDVTRIRAGVLSLRKERFDLGALVRATAEGYPARMFGKDIKITVSTEEAFGDWDRFRIEQVITNLIGNAVKYGEGHPVDVSLKKEGDEVVLVVRDRGIGIPDERLADVFEPFSRAASSTRYTGLGLGLYIVRRIVEAHQGNIKIESTEGVGTTVRVSLPAAAFRVLPAN